MIGFFIIIAGIKLIFETINPLIGVGPDSEFVKKIIYDIEAFEGVLGIHDVICHMYGPTTCFMSVHVEVDCRSDINVSHDLIDNIENDMKKKHNVFLVIHMDPIITDSEEVNKLKEFANDKDSFIVAKAKAENSMYKNICRTERITENHAGKWCGRSRRCRFSNLYETDR